MKKEKYPQRKYGVENELRMTIGSVLKSMEIHHDIPRRRFVRLVLAVCLAMFLHGSVFSQNLGSIVSNVDTIWSPASPGRIIPLTNAAIGVAAGNERTASFPSAVAYASQAGAARIAVFGSEDFFTDAAIQRFDNLTIALNTVRWLDQLNRKTVAMTSGHGETTVDNHLVLQNALQDQGYTVNVVSGALTSSALTNVGVLFVGNAQSSFTSAELSAINGFFQSSGSAFLLGNGASWLATHPGSTLDQYPMNQVGALCGYRWIDGAIADPVNNANGQPLFLSFYPAVEFQSVPSAWSFIDSVATAYPTNISAALQYDEALRPRYRNANFFLKLLTMELPPPPNSPLRDLIFSNYRSLLNRSPQFRKGTVVYNAFPQSAMAWQRESIHRMFADMLPLNVNLRTQIANILGLTGLYRDAWIYYSVMFLDNNFLDYVSPGEFQKKFLYQFLSALPEGIHNLRSISVTDYLGETNPPVPLDGLASSINISGVRVGWTIENPFPPEIGPQPADAFMLGMIHEFHRVVDSYYVEKDSTLRNRRQALLSFAGSDSLNYLRSTRPRSFFVQNQKEFFPSLADLWFIDSETALTLALQRFRNGRTQPLNQLLFFADVYSVGTALTSFYKTSTSGLVTTTLVSVTRNANKFINSLTVGTTRYSFVLNNQGNVTTVTSVGDHSTFELPTEYELEPNYPNPFNGSTFIRYRLPARSRVSLTIHNLLGEKIATLFEGIQEPGNYSLQWNTDQPSSVYFCRWQAEGVVLVRKLILLK